MKKNLWFLFEKVFIRLRRVLNGKASKLADKGKMFGLENKHGQRQPETHTKRQATQHDFLPCLLGDGDKGIEIVNDEVNIFFSGPTTEPRQNKNLLYRHDKPRVPTKEGPLSFVLFLSSHSRQFYQFSRGHPSLVATRQCFLFPIVIFYGLEDYWIRQT
jgi:hypothetical protein